MRYWPAAPGFFAAFLHGAADAAAQSSQTAVSHPPFLSVTRDSGAETCPDTAALAAHVASIRGTPATSVSGTYQVTFTFRGGAYGAAIRSGKAQGERVLHDRGSSCSSLAQATAVTLALLVDSDADPTTEEVAPLLAPASARQFAQPEPKRTGALDRPTMSAFLFTLGGAALAGVTNPLTPALTGDLGISVSRFRAHVGALWAIEQKHVLPPGRVSESLTTGLARMCLAPWRSQQLRLDLCTGVYVGVTSVRASGYTRNEHANKAWLAVPLELSFIAAPSFLGFEASAGALLPVRRDDFAIDNVGVAYRSWPIGALVSLRGVVAWLR